MQTIKNCWKKVLAYVCAIALVVTSLTVYQADVSADTDYSTLTYTTLSCDNGPDVNYCVLEDGITGWNGVWYGDAGNTFQPIYAGDGVNETADTKVSVNGVDTPVGTGAFTTAASGIVKINPTVLPDNAYSVVEITATTGKAVIVFKKGNPTSGGAAAPETTTEAGPTEPVVPSDWADGTDTWTTNGVWNIWTGNGAVSRYKGNNTLEDYTVNVITAAGEWSVQTNTVYSGLTNGKMYDYTITIESDKEGASVGVREENSGSPLRPTTLVAGENKITGTFTAANSAAKFFLEMGNTVNSGATFHITGVEVTEYVEDDSEGIPADAKWLGWFEAENWANYDISTDATGYTLTDKNIGANWYSIQTGIDDVKFKAGEEYRCTFTLTAASPKQFKVDNRSNDANVFVESTPGSWTENEDGTYSYKFDGTYKNATAASQFINVRIALGYFAEDTNYAASSNLTCTVSDFKIENVTGSTPPVETTTPDSGEQPPVEPTTPTPVQTEQSDATYAAGFADLMNTAFLLGDVGANQYKAVCGNGLINAIVNIQQPEDATEAGIYVNFKDASFGTITINGVPLDHYINGSGVVMYLSNFEYMYSDVVVMSGDGSQKAVIYVYNAQGIDNSDKALESETPSTGDTPANITLQRLPATNAHQEFGSYKVAASLNLEAYAGIDPTNRDRIQVKNASGPSSESFTVSRAFKGLTAGTKYVLSVDITPSIANGSYKTLKDTEYKALQEGTTTVSMVSTAYNDGTGVIQADFVLYVNQLGTDVTLDISNPQYRVATDEDLTTQAPTTESPTTVKPDDPTVAPTTTANQDNPTVAPTTTANQDNPTVAPTTVSSEKVTAPAKAKIKKVNTKKKAAKKVKLTLKKVKSAAGYQVAVYKTKKNAKKNKKALVKKTVKKLKVTVKSKKLKNKKKLYVRARAYVLDANGTKVYGKWSKVKTVKIKK